MKNYILHPRCRDCICCLPNGVPDIFSCAAGIELECIGYPDVYIEV